MASIEAEAILPQHLPLYGKDVMFTGIVEEVGAIEAITQLEDSLRLRITGRAVLEAVGHGDSIAVDGVCLTVVDYNAHSFEVDVMQETLNRSALGSRGVGAQVNLERAVKVGSRLDGHIVQGHVDGVATLLSRNPSEHWDVLRLSLPAQLQRFVVEKGSIALNGTSLTVSGVGEGWVEVSLIPTTLEVTTFGKLQVGELVNVEVDVLAKYVESMLQAGVGQVL